MRRGPGAAEVNDFAPHEVADPDVPDEYAQFVKVFQVPPHHLDLRGSEVFRAGREILHDAADWEVAMLFGPVPRFGAVQFGFVVIRPVGLPPSFSS